MILYGANQIGLVVLLTSEPIFIELKFYIILILCTYIQSFIHIHICNCMRTTLYYYSENILLVGVNHLECKYLSMRYL